MINRKSAVENISIEHDAPSVNPHQIKTFESSPTDAR
jgi:hypothetical protein